jgi:hypothetical protein
MPVPARMSLFELLDRFLSFRLDFSYQILNDLMYNILSDHVPLN